MLALPNFQLQFLEGTTCNSFLFQFSSQEWAGLMPTNLNFHVAQCTLHNSVPVLWNLRGTFPERGPIKQWDKILEMGVVTRRLKSAAGLLQFFVHYSTSRDQKQTTVHILPVKWHSTQILVSVCCKEYIVDHCNSAVSESCGKQSGCSSPSCKWVCHKPLVRPASKAMVTSTLGKACASRHKNDDIQHSQKLLEFRRDDNRKTFHLELQTTYVLP